MNAVISSEPITRMANIQAWMHRHQECALQASVDLAESRGATAAV